MRISGAFPSNYLKAADLQGKSPVVTIDKVHMEDIGSEQKPILYFSGKEKGLVLNKTNANNIADAYGDETDQWSGHKLQLFEALVDFQGRTVPAIRVRAHRGEANAPLQEQPAPTPDPQTNGGDFPLDDEVPF